MKTIMLYTGGGISFSTEFVEGRTESNYVRLAADDGMILVNGEREAFCVDVPKTDAGNWQEIEYVEDPDLDNAETLEILLGGAGE